MVPTNRPDGLMKAFLSEVVRAYMTFVCYEIEPELTLGMAYQYTKFNQRRHLSLAYIDIKV